MLTPSSFTIGSRALGRTSAARADRQSLPHSTQSMHYPDHHLIVERQRCKTRDVANMIDPLVACDRRDPWPERLRRRVGVPLGMNCKKRILPRIFGRRRRKPPGVVGAQLGAQFSEQCLIVFRRVARRSSDDAISRNILANSRMVVLSVTPAVSRWVNAVEPYCRHLTTNLPRLCATSCSSARSANIRQSWACGAACACDNRAICGRIRNALRGVEICPLMHSLRGCVCGMVA
jgi:hypothetical protein